MSGFVRWNLARFIRPGPSRSFCMGRHLWRPIYLHVRFCSLEPCQIYSPRPKQIILHGSTPLETNLFTCQVLFAGTLPDLFAPAQADHFAWVDTSGDQFIYMSGFVRWNLARFIRPGPSRSF